MARVPPEPSEDDEHSSEWFQPPEGIYGDVYWIDWRDGNAAAVYDAELRTYYRVAFAAIPPHIVELATLEHLARRLAGDEPPQLEEMVVLAAVYHGHALIHLKDPS